MNREQMRTVVSNRRLAVQVESVTSPGKRMVASEVADLCHPHGKRVESLIALL